MYPTPDYSRFAPITADMNHLYDKHTIIVQPANPVTQDALGGQVVSFGTPYPIKANVQFFKLEEPTVPVNFKTRAGRLYTRVVNRLKQFDRFTHDGVVYTILGVEEYRDNIKFEPHHAEAVFEQLQSTVPRA